tara:strand:+ start:368 stop:808 length:441 start_codon:yes stop_codon:yes gene_type:complete
MEVPATLAVAAAAAVFPKETWLKCVLVANAAVGFVYMWREERPLMDPGTRAFGRQWPIPSPLVGWIVNIVAHVVATIVILRRMESGVSSVWKAVALEALGVALIDLKRVYPTRRSIVPYVIAHVAVTCAGVLLLAGGEEERTESGR